MRLDDAIEIVEEIPLDHWPDEWVEAWSIILDVVRIAAVDYPPC